MQLLDLEIEAWHWRYFYSFRLLGVIETCQRHMWVEFLTMLTLVNRVIGEGGRQPLIKFPELFGVGRFEEQSVFEATVTVEDEIKWREGGAERR